jgi:hypothetical protein
MPEIETTDDIVLALGDLGLEPFPEDAITAYAWTALEREIICERHHRPKPLRRRRWRKPSLRLAVSFAALMAAGGGAYAALSDSSQLSAGIECHAGDSLASSGTITAVNGEVATATCARLWAQGNVGAGRTPPSPLQACVEPNGSGAIHVLPSTDTNICQRIGLRADPQAGASPDARHYARFQDGLTKWLNTTGSRCVTDTAVRAEVNGELARARLTGWSITTRGVYTSQKPCASVAIDSTVRTLTIFPIQRP